ncbi:MAG: SurA N-terminal domain-containing protein [Candidatus Hydrogenedentes bacterium]|nr:SurA N-terminal domain-containing protein [Candidatus Hydrogenedentota bacterium]
MQHLVRKHRALLGFIIFMFIGVPMLFWGVPGMTGSDSPIEQGTLATVGGIPIMARDYRDALQRVAEQRGQGGERPSFEELDKSGDADRVLKEMIDSALMTHLGLQSGYDVDDEFLEERMREWGIFQDDAGKFNPAAWNEWVKTQRDAGRDWNQLYDGMREDIARELFVRTQLASAARVLDSEVTKELEASHTKMVVKYIKVEPEVVPTEEQLQTEFETNQESYRKADVLTAEYAAVSLKPELTEDIRLIGERAKTEDFAALANEVSDIKTGNGGEIAGWQTQRDTEADYRLPLFALAPGQVSDVAVGPSGFYIYKVDEEQVNAETGKREVKARQIYKQAQLTEEERAARDNQVQAILDAANEKKELASVAQEQGLVMQSIPAFAADAVEVPGVPAVDARTLRTQLGAQTDDTVYVSIPCQSAIYVARVTSRIKGDIPPLDEVREKVSIGASLKIKGDESYQNLVNEYKDKIAGLAGPLDLVPLSLPELKVEVKQTTEFTKKDFLFQQQIFVNTAEIFDAFEGVAPGARSGALSGMLGDTYFFELVSLTTPTEEERAGWEEEKKTLHLQAMRRSEMELFDDFRRFISEKYLQTIDWSINDVMLSDILGRDIPGATPPADAAAPAEGTETGAAAPTDGAVTDAAAPVDAAPVDAAPVAADVAPAAEAAPATETAPAAEAPAASDAAPATEGDDFSELPAGQLSGQPVL